MKVKAQRPNKVRISRDKLFPPCGTLSLDALARILEAIHRRGSNILGLTAFEFINQGKVTFFSARLYPNFSLTKLIACAFLRFRVRESPEKYFFSSM